MNPFNIFQGYELQGKLFLITRRRAKEKINSILPSKLFVCFSSFKQQLKRESRRTKINFFTPLTWKNGPTMNDNIENLATERNFLRFKRHTKVSTALL